MLYIISRECRRVVYMNEPSCATPSPESDMNFHFDLSLIRRQGRNVDKMIDKLEKMQLHPSSGSVRLR